jgi:hypothetical protein
MRETLEIRGEDQSIFVYMTICSTKAERLTRWSAVWITGVRR